jgi:hypothetical protein
MLSSTHPSPALLKRCAMSSLDPGAEARKEIQQIQKRIMEINAEYAYLMAKKATDGETAKTIYRLQAERSGLSLRRARLSRAQDDQV